MTSSSTSSQGEAHPFAERTRKKSMMLLAACFFCSGAASLLFETVWARSFGLILGNSLQGISLVGAAFLGGLGLGAALAARFADRVARPIAWYAAVEGLVALWGLLGVWLLPALPGLLASMLSAPEPGPGAAILRLIASIVF